MTGLMVALVVCLTTICLASLTVAGFLIWWTMDSAGQHSISAGKQTTLAVEAMREGIAQQATVVGLVTTLTEMVILGRPIPETSQELVIEKPPETSLTPDDVWSGLPQAIQDNLLREAEEAGIWPSPSEQLQNASGLDTATP
jgi:hypothetical protein